MAMRYYAPFPGGEPLGRRGPHALRVGDAERDAAAADLGEHYVAGRLTLDELNERLDAVFSAKTFGQLAKVMTDLPESSWPRWRADPWERPGLGPHGWGPNGFTSGAPDRTIDGRRDARSAMGGSAPRPLREAPMATDRAGRFAALALLVLAMLIWLFTALLFARHGYYHPGPYDSGPSGPFGHLGPHNYTLQLNMPQPPTGP